jgi:hypothetical protein
MSKLNCVVAGFADAYSEYGKMTVNIVQALLAVRGDIWDITVVNTADNKSSMGYLDDHQWLKEYMVDVVTTQPDIWIQIGSPELFMRHGILFNVGISASNVSNIISRKVIDGINRMDLMLTVSKLSHDIITNTILEYRNNVELQVTDKVSIPVENLDLGVNSILDTFTKSTMLPQVKEEYCFIYNGLWKHPVDLNNIHKLVYAFYNAFQGYKKTPALLLKTNVNTPSILDSYRVENRIKEIKILFKNPNALPPVYIINGNLTDEQMMGIYNNPKVKCMVTASSNETIGLHIKEFQLTGKPILSTGWGSQTDLGDAIMTVDTKLVDINPTLISDVIPPNSKYAEPDFGQLSSAMVHLYMNKPIIPNKKLFKSSVTAKSLDMILSKYILNTTKSNYLPEVEEFEL